MAREDDSIQVTLTRAEALTVKRVLYAYGHGKDAVQSALLKIKRALEPVTLPDPATFKVVEPKPKGTTWPRMHLTKCPSIVDPQAACTCLPDDNN